MRDDTGNKAGRNNATAKNNLKSIDKMTNQTAERCIKALTRNGFDVRTAATAAEAGEIIRSIIDQTAPASISFGDSMTLYATGTVAWLRALMNYRFDELAACAIEASQATLLLAFAHTWCATHLDAHLRAFEFLLGF